MSDKNLEKAYALLEKKRLANVAKNAEEGRTMNIKGTPLNPPKNRAPTLSEAMDSLRQEGKLTNLEDTLKTTPTDTIGIKPEIRNKSKFFNLDNKMGGGDLVDDAAKIVNEESGILKNSKGMSRGILPMLGLGATALTAMGILNKANAGEIKEAAVDTADLATDYVPVVNQLKMALRSEGLGKGNDDVTGLEPFVQEGVDQTPRNERATYEELKRVSQEGIKGKFPKLLNKFDK
jgi:hypothetical protein